MKKRPERTMTKTAFILSLPKDTPAKAVVAKGKENGMEMSEAYVHAIRSAARRPKKGGEKRGPGRKGGRAAATSQAGRGSKGRRGPAPSKREFILSMPASTPVAEVVAEGAKRGIKISAHYVYNLRSNASKGARKGGGGLGRGRGASTRGPGGTLESSFVGMALDLGLARASELLAHVKDRLRTLAI